MSYVVDVYFDDPRIAQTKITKSDGSTITKNYGDGDAFYRGDFSGTTTFTVKAASNCKFKNWVYRLGGDSGDRQYSTSATFTYSGGSTGSQKIIIRAEGVKSSYRVVATFDDANIKHTKIQNTDVGATWGYYGDDDYSVSGLSGDTVFTATPVDGHTFSHWKYTLTDFDLVSTSESSDNPFYYYGDAKNNADISIKAVSVGGGSGGGGSWVQNTDLNALGVTASKDKTKQWTIEKGNVYRQEIVFATGGISHFSTEGDLDTVGYLSLSKDWSSDNSGPLIEEAFDDNSGDGNNFDIEYTVKAQTSYYLFIRCKTKDKGGSVTLRVTKPVETEVTTRPDDFSWTYPKTKGGTFNLTATEWNDFTRRINEFRVYKQQSYYSFTTAYPGNQFTAEMYKQARDAILGIPGRELSAIPDASPRGTVQASALNTLVRVLNGIT